MFLVTSAPGLFAGGAGRSPRCAGPGAASSVPRPGWGGRRAGGGLPCPGARGVDHPPGPSPRKGCGRPSPLRARAAWVIVLARILGRKVPVFPLGRSVVRSVVREGAVTPVPAGPVAAGAVR
ncbi:hypothetical protein GCM10010327_14400 [Streptomyces nitrosporeus]|nr:hypothetical protein GCM10010327_14400 [Streptomyces nitrosporeus]